MAPLLALNVWINSTPWTNSLQQARPSQVRGAAQEVSSLGQSEASQPASPRCNHSHLKECLFNLRYFLFDKQTKSKQQTTTKKPSCHSSVLTRNQGLCSVSVRAGVCLALTFTSQSGAFGGAAAATAQRPHPAEAGVPRGGRWEAPLGHSRRDPPRLRGKPTARRGKVPERGRWIRSASRT